ncbi:MAG: hypothetical protein U1A05_01510 [Alphaproteobacteria bacterium]|nr:hypothetical protein [Alphaproteobacteria bacterium]
MKEISTRDLKESLTLLFLRTKDDWEGGWHEEWQEGPRVWAAVWPLLNMQAQCPAYRLTLRATITLPPQSKFLWPLLNTTKRLRVINSPSLIQYNRFLTMIAEEEENA